jgi:hypothetical protein
LAADKASRLHLQEFIRSPLNVLPDRVTVSGFIEKRSGDEHVKRSPGGAPPVAALVSLQKTLYPQSGSDGRHSTIDCQPTTQTVGFLNDDFKSTR